nr:hypothetical protein [Natrinema gelatinilyticum]
MTRPASDPVDGAPTRRKATLFCWECDHTNPIDGDWVLQSRPTFVAYICPDCETTLGKRPRRRPSKPSVAATRPIVAWREAFRVSATVWRASVDASTSSLVALFGASGRT